MHRPPRKFVRTVTDSGRIVWTFGIARPRERLGYALGGLVMSGMLVAFGVVSGAALFFTLAGLVAVTWTLIAVINLQTIVNASDGYCYRRVLCGGRVWKGKQRRIDGPLVTLVRQERRQPGKSVPGFYLRVIAGGKERGVQHFWLSEHRQAHHTQTRLERDLRKSLRSPKMQAV